MIRLCLHCGKKFDTGEITDEQLVFYGETICRQCWKERTLAQKCIVK